MIGNAREDIGLFHIGAGIVNAWRVDDQDTLSSNLTLYDADLSGTRMEALPHFLLL